MSLLTTLDALEAAGATAEVILAVVRAHEAQREALAEQRREKDAARKKAERVRNGHAESRGHADETVESSEPSPHAGARTQVVIPSLPSLRSEELMDDDVDCASAVPSSDWPQLTGKQTWASVLAETIASPWLAPTKSPGLVETAGRVVAWRRDGASWEHDVIPVVTALCVKAGKRIGTWKYFDGSIGQSIAANRAALEIPEAGSVIPPRSHERPNGHSPATASRAARRGVWAEVLAEECGPSTGLRAVS